MGKPFHSELEQVWETYDWALHQQVDEIRSDLLHNIKKPLYIVGSGGSLSVCHHIAALYQSNGMMAKAVTPLELYYSRHALRDSNVLFVSASGKNTDILFGYKVAIAYEPNKIYSICMKRNTPLSKLATKVSISKHFDFNLPSGKDGFLATNSLIAFFTLSNRIFSGTHQKVSFNSFEFQQDVDHFLEQVSSDHTFLVLHAGWGTSVAVDIESKLAEAALGNVLIADWRNFGHGRHHWFDKRGGTSAIISITTPQEKQLADKTLALLPKGISVLHITTDIEGPSASIELLIKTFYFVEKLGTLQGIDPGRPGVPEYGRKLYHLSYQKLYNVNDQTLKKTAITRKADVQSFDALTPIEQTYWSNAYDAFVRKLQDANFGAAIFDYDGTLCSASNRFIGVDEKIASGLNIILEKGFIIGIATGRGKSAREDLQKAIDEKFWPRVLVGYYNCGEIGLLSDNTLPDKKKVANQSLIYIYEQLKLYKFPFEIFPELKANQLVIEIKDKSQWAKVRQSIIQLVIRLDVPNIQILESSHSMDIIDQAETNKLNIVEYCLTLAKKHGLMPEVICFGDKGKWPGNDHQLLSTCYSLSVDEVTALTDSCWNLSQASIKNTDAMLGYMSALKFSEKYFQIQL
ncbi:HAD hydrolase family protein [Mucilaginibacter pedocola]|uniref:SIS domain-containing protein n=1 Tax=Mucilaginibacter pedocola TaxID=1792845 RepID=A0A1S9PLT6_9SPHI|nr:HAD hydrolase family protein [Mucilaginibacter pedocola]OOQ61923.1 hypothetical protein BC343_02350 [Mucilaginibacter pedocola]